MFKKIIKAALKIAAVSTGISFLTGSFVKGMFVKKFFTYTALLGLNAITAKGTNNTSGKNLGLKAATTNPVAPRNVVYGKTRVGGTIVHRAVSGTNNNKLHNVIAIAAHEINAIKKLYIDGGKGVVELDFSSDFATATENGATVYRVTNSAFTNTDNDASYTGGSLIKLVVEKGEQTTSNGYAVAQMAEWTTDHKLQGIAYVYINCIFDTEKFASYPSFSFEVEGKKVYDPVTTTTAYSTNPSLIIRDYLMDATYGFGATSDEINDAATGAGFVKARSDCNDDVTITSGTEDRYTLNGQFDMSEEPQQVLQHMLSACAGQLIYNNGKFSLFVGKERTASGTITDDKLLAPIQITTKASGQDLANGVKATYVRPTDRYIAAEITPYKDSTYLSADTPSGEQSANYENFIDVTFPYTQSTFTAQRLARIALDYQRQDQTLQVIVPIEFMTHQVGDIVNFTNTRLGYDGKDFEIVAMDFEFMADDYLALRLNLKEYSATVFNNISYVADPTLPSPPSAGDNTVATPTGLTLTESSKNTTAKEIYVRAVWTNANDDKIDWTEVAYKKSTDTEFDAAIVGYPRRSFSFRAESATTYNIKVRHGSNNGVHGDYTGVVNITTSADVGTFTTGSIAGITVESDKLYEGTGTFNNSNTGFYLDNTGQFSLKDKLSFNGTTLNISGNLTVENTISANKIVVDGINLDNLISASTQAGSIYLTEFTGIKIATAGGTSGYPPLLRLQDDQGTNTFTDITQTTQLNIRARNNTAKGKISFQGVDSGGTPVNYGGFDASGNFEIGLTDVIDASRNLLNVESIKLADSKELLLGTSSDVRLLHNGTDTHILNNTGDLFISNFADDKDIVFRSDDGSGGVTEYFRLDGANVQMVASQKLAFSDNVRATFGNSSDLQIYHDGSDSIIHDNGTGNLKIRATNLRILNAAGTQNFISHNDGGDVKLYFAGNQKLATTSSGVAITGNATISGDLTVSGTTTTINTTNLDVADKNITLNFGSGDTSSNADGAGITIQDAVDASTDATILWDATNDEFDFSHGITLPDDKRLKLGTGSDLQLFHNGSSSVIRNDTGHLDIKNGANDADIRFMCDDGSGGETSYFILDGSQAQSRFLRNVQFDDSIKAKFGSAGDLEIYHDGSNSYIWEKGTGNLIVRGTEFRLQDSSGNQQLVTNSGAGVGLYHNASIKMETTSSGINVTGTVDASADVTLDGKLSIEHDGSNTGDVLSLFSNRFNQTTMYGFGLASGTLYYKANTRHQFYNGSNYDNSSFAMELDDNRLRLAVPLSMGTTTVIDTSRNLTNIGTISSGAITATQLTVDDITINGSTISDSGNFTIDATEIRLDSDSAGVIRLKDSGTEYGKISQNSNNLRIFSSISDGDILLQGNDGGSTITALQLDMSAGGDATFAGSVTATSLSVSSAFSTTANINISGTSGKYQINSLDVIEYSGGFRVGSVADDDESLTLVGFGGQPNIVLDDSVIQFKFSTSEKMRLDSSGRLGIGTTAPSVALHVSKSGTDAKMRIQDTDGTNQFTTFTQNGGQLQIFARNNTNNGSIQFFGNNGSASTEYARFNNSGRFGIGTTAPSNALDVRSAANIQLKLASTTSSNNSRMNFAPNNTEAWNIGANVSGGNFTFFDVVNSTTPFKIEPGAGTNTLVVDTQSRVGIGTNAPSQTLDVAGNIQATGSRLISAAFDSNHYMRLEGNSSGGVLKGADGGVVTTLVRSYGDSYFNSGGGNFGIGVSNPTVLLDILGTGEVWHRITTSSSNLNGIRLGSSDGTRQNVLYRDRSNDLVYLRSGIDNADIAIIAGGSTNEIMRFDGENSRVGIGTTSPSEALHVVGNILTSGGVKVGDSSADALHFHGILKQGSGSGTTVMDSSRNLTNVGTITNTGRHLIQSGNLQMNNGDNSHRYYYVATSSGGGDFLLGQIELNDGVDGAIEGTVCFAYDYGTTSESPKIHFSFAQRNGTARGKWWYEHDDDAAGSNNVKVVLIDDGSGGMFVWLRVSDFARLSLNVITRHGGNWTGSGQLSSGTITTGTTLFDTSNDPTSEHHIGKLFAHGDSEIEGQLTIGSGNNLVNAGNMTVDVAGDLTLDADGGDIMFKDGGTERARFNATGLGIGTTTPNFLLDVEGTGSTLARLNSTSGSALFQMSVPDTTSICDINFGDTGHSQRGQIRYRHNGDSLAFLTAQTEALRIDSSQRVGIGTSSPARPLDVNGSARLSDGASLEWGGTSSYIAGSSSSNTLFFNTASTERARIDSSGNLCLGNTSAAAKLDIRQDSGFAIRCENSSGHYFRVNSTGAVEVAGSEVITASRNLTNIGTISSGAITSSGTEFILGSSSVKSRIRTINSSGFTETAFDNFSSGAYQERMRISSSGSVGIAKTNPSSSYKLDVNGKIRSQQEILINTGSLFINEEGEGIHILSANGTEYKLTVSDAGALVITEV